MFQKLCAPNLEDREDRVVVADLDDRRLVTKASGRRVQCQPGCSDRRRDGRRNGGRLRNGRADNCLGYRNDVGGAATTTPAGRHACHKYSQSKHVHDAMKQCRTAR